MDKPEADGLTPYLLGREYGENPAGTVLRVDTERKKWLDENGYRGAPNTEKTAEKIAEKPILARDPIPRPDRRRIREEG